MSFVSATQVGMVVLCGLVTLCPSSARPAPSCHNSSPGKARLDPWANLVAVAEPSLPASEVADEPPTLTKEEPVPLETQVRGPCFPHFQERKDPRDLVDRTAVLW